MTWDYPKKEDMGKRRMIPKHSFGKNEKSYRYFVVENPHILF
jgi:hypothetical protein